jgi:DNA uptake protein ComE-like DNA-binding protein
MLARHRIGAWPRHQRLGLFTLLFLTVGCCYWWSPGASVPEASTAYVNAHQIILQEAQKRESGAPSQVPASFAFDPNSVSVDELVELGLSEKQARSWIKFRGDRPLAFRSPEDIRKLYVLSDEEKERLIALAVVPERRASEGAGARVQRFSFDPNTVGLQDLQKLGLSKKQAAAWIKFRGDRERAFKSPEDIRKLYVLSEGDKDRLVSLAVIEDTPPNRPQRQRERFAWDPNRTPADSLSRLGFLPWEVNALLRYRGDRPVTFRYPEAVRRVTALDSNFLTEVIPLIRLALPEPAVPAGPRENDARTTPKAFPAPKVAPPTASFDINQSTQADWETLPGIGPYRAKRITRFREALGGFRDLDQVGDTRGLPDSTFQRIKPWLKASPITRKIHVNRADFDRLNRHPYISRKLANNIISYRKKHGRYESVEDLRALRLLTADNLEQLLPYLSFE